MRIVSVEHDYTQSSLALAFLVDHLRVNRLDTQGNTKSNFPPECFSILPGFALDGTNFTCLSPQLDLDSYLGENYALITYRKGIFYYLESTQKYSRSKKADSLTVAPLMLCAISTFVQLRVFATRLS